MNKFKNKYGSLALVAGASEGLGLAWTRALAAHGMDLIIVARREEQLIAVALALQEQYKIKVQSICCDLASPDAVKKIVEETGDKQISFLVYNAAAAYIGPFHNNSLSAHQLIVSVNISASLGLVHALAGPMLLRGRGAIVLMTSLAGFQGSGFLTTYAATKAFIRIFAESLWYEWKEKGVDVIACCAGATTTPNYLRSAPEKISFAAPRPQSPEAVVEECLRKLGKTPSFISGRGNKLASFFMQHIFSRKRAINIMGSTTRKMYRIRD